MNIPTQIEPTIPASNPLDLMTVATNLSLTEDLKMIDTSPLILKLTALEMIDLHYPEKDWLRAYIDGAQKVKAGVHCKLFLKYATVSVNKSNFDGEIKVISLALQQLLYRLQAFEKVVILVDSKAAIPEVSSKSATVKEDKRHKTGLQTSPDFQENSHIPEGSLKCWTRRQRDIRQTSQKVYCITY
jgi:hypothetical protein